ncbi:hypothetical protein ACSQ67_013031 [Phaseolus vulgaris]
MSLPDSPVPDDTETDPSEDEEQVEEETEEEEEEEEEEAEEEEEIEEEVEEEVEEEEGEEEEVEEVDEEEEVEEVEEEEEEVEEVEVEEEEVEVDEEEEVEQEVKGEEEVKEEEGEEETLEDKKERQEQKQKEAVEEEKEGQPQQQEKAVEEQKKEQQRQEEAVEEKEKEQQQQQNEAVEEKKKAQQQQHEKTVEEKKKEQQLQQEEAMEKEGRQKEEVGEDKGRKDLSLHMESKEQDKNLGPDSSVAENSDVIPSSSVHCMEENDNMLKISVPSCEILTSKKEEFHQKYDISSHSKSRENLTSVENSRSKGLEVDGENAGSLLQKETHRGYSELGCNSKANLCDDNDIDSGARASKPSSDTGQDMVIGLFPKDCLVEDANGGQNSRNNITQLEMESRDDMKQMLTRGSSCSFLHIKDSVDKTDQEVEADLATVHQKRKLKVEEGVRENVQRIRMNEQEETPSWHPSQEKQNFKLRDNLFPENRFAFSSTSNYFSPKQDGMATLRNQHMYKGYASTFLSHSPNSRQEDFPLVSSSRAPSYPTGYKSKICSYDWEPSVPFRPSFFITSMNVSSPGDLYDPLRDSIEIPNIGDGSLKASLLIQGSNRQTSTQAPIYGDSAVVGKHMSSLNDDKSSVSSHNKVYETETNKNSVPHEKDYLPTETEITSGTYRRIRAQKKRGDRDKKNHEMDVDFPMDGSMQKEVKALKMLRAALVDHVKELLKPVWHEGRLSKDEYIMIVRKSVDKVVSSIEPHQIPTIDTAKQYVSSSRVKIAKLVNGYVNKYGKS